MNRDFRRLWAAQGTSAVGSRLTRTALPVLAILTIDAGPTELGILAALSVAPGAVVGLLAGGMVDRSSKRRILIGADLARLALLATVPIAAHLGLLSMAQLFIVAALAGCATTLFQITDNTYLPVLVPRDRLIDANARLETTEAAAEIVGPSLAGVLIELITAPLTILIDALTYAASAALIATIGAREIIEPSPEQPRLGADVAAGARAVWGQPVVRRLFLAGATSAFWGGFFAALYMLFCLDTLELGPGAVGVIIAVGGVGALLGAQLGGRIARRRRAGPVLIALLALHAAGGLMIPLAGSGLAASRWSSIALLVGHQLVGDGFAVAYMVLAVSLRQTLVPPEVLGRANAWFQLSENVLVTTGAVIAGGLAAALGVTSALWCGMAGGLTAPLLLLPLLRHRQRLG